MRQVNANTLGSSTRSTRMLAVNPSPVHRIQAAPPGRRSIAASLPNQPARPSAVVSAAHTFSGGWASSTVRSIRSGNAMAASRGSNLLIATLSQPFGCVNGPVAPAARSGPAPRRRASLQIRAGPVIDLHELDRRPPDLDEGDGYARAGAVRLDDDIVALEGGRQVVDLECHVWHGLDQVGIGRGVPVPLPLDAERVVQMIADCHLQVRQRNLAVERAGGRDANMVEPHQPASGCLKPARYP